MIEENIDEFIERYLTGRLDLRELAIIENEIKMNDKFAARVALNRNILLGIHEAKKIELKQKLQKLDLKNIKSAGLFEIRTFFTQYSIAASVLIGLILTVSVLLYTSRAKEINSKIAEIVLKKDIP